MKHTLSTVLLVAVIAAGGFLRATAQEVFTTNLVTQSKERVLRIESIIHASQKDVWKMFSTEEGLKKWAAPVVALDLRIGGSLSAQYDTNASIGGPGTIRSGIVHYLEPELITYKVNLTSEFPKKAQTGDRNLQEIVQIVPWTNGTTKVISSMVGWGTGKEWDDTYNFFAKGNAWTYQQLVKCFPPDKK